jgi:hypothetical protein
VHNVPAVNFPALELFENLFDLFLVCGHGMLSLILVVVKILEVDPVHFMLHIVHGCCPWALALVLGYVLAESDVEDLVVLELWLGSSVILVADVANKGVLDVLRLFLTLDEADHDLLLNVAHYREQNQNLRQEVS